MAKLDMNRMRRSYEANARGGDIWSPPQGLTKLYIHGPCREDDTYELTAGTNYLAIVVHYGLGKDGAMALSLDADRNPILLHPFIQAELKRRGIKLPKRCPIAQAIESGAMSPDEAEESRPVTRFLFGITPVMQKLSKTAAWQKLTPKPQVMLVGTTIYNGIMDIFMENDDITDMDAAIFAIVGREGTGKFGTKYTVKADPDTIKSPKRLPDAVRRLLLKAMKPGGDCDLFRIVANMIKSPEEIKAILAGVTVATGRGRARDDEGGDWDDDVGDGELEDGVLEDGDDEDEEDAELEDGDEDEEDAELEDGDDEDAELEDGDDEDGDDEDADDEDADDEDADDEDAPAPKKSKTAPKKSKTDDDDLGLDELDAELEKIAAKAKAKKAKK